jgi:protein involved in temperature-dependent protein secretion
MVLVGTDRHGEAVELQCTKTEFLSAQFFQKAHTCSNSQWSRGTEQLAVVETFSASATLHTAMFLMLVYCIYTHIHGVTKVHDTDMSDEFLDNLSVPSSRVKSFDH